MEGKHAPSERTADLSRRHTVRVSPEGLVTVTGGKLTTYRKMAEDTVDAALGVLGRTAGPCVTKSLRLRGATGRPSRARPPTARAARRGTTAPDGTGSDPGDDATAVAAHLAGRYGNETPAVLALADGRPELLEPLVPGLHYLAAEAVYAVEEEMASSVDDVLDRRTRASLRDARGAAEAATGWPTSSAPSSGGTRRAPGRRGRVVRRGHPPRSGPGRTRPP